MDVAAIVARVRDHYVEQFKAFTDKQKRDCNQGAPEVKLQLSESSELFQRLYCVDFIKNDAQSEAIELKPGNILTFNTISGSFGLAAVSIEHLRWDDVVIYHNLTALPPDPIKHWFRRWFDPDDERYDRGLGLSCVIHSLLIRPGMLSVDFGTAPPEAFWAMLELLERAGASTIRITSSEADLAANA
ncbi:MAG: hypothetical protein ACLPX9_09710 [Rhodomicrobium sp.]